MYILRLFDEADPKRPIDARLLREGALTVGRDPACEWMVPDLHRQISRAHCRLSVAAGWLELEGIGANGVFDDETGERLGDGAATRLVLPATLRLGTFRITASLAPQEAMAPGAEGRTMLLLPPIGDTAELPSDWQDAGEQTRGFVDGSLLEAFCAGAGLDSSRLTGDDPAKIMYRAGAVYRQMVLGIGDLMAERDRARARYQLTRTTITGSDNNPFKWAPTQRLAVDLLLAGSEGFLSGPAALKASLRDIKRHLMATFEGLQASLRTAIDSFAPEALAAGRTSLIKSRATSIAEAAAARHADLRRQIDGADGSLNHAFVAAYDAAEAGIDRSTV